MRLEVPTVVDLSMSHQPLLLASLAIIFRVMVHLCVHMCCSERYYDDIYEYRHVVLPPEIAKKVPKGRLMSEVRVDSGRFIK